jgi:nucleotide-binding universal stress UspA family protein
MLIRAGLTESMIAFRRVERSRSAAHDILEQARKMNGGTILLGRRGLSGIKELIMGCVTRKIIHNSGEISVWVVSFAAIRKLPRCPIAG